MQVPYITYRLIAIAKKFVASSHNNFNFCQIAFVDSEV